MEEIDCLMKKLEKFENTPFDIQDILNTSVSNVICSLLFGKRFDYEDPKFKHFIISLNKLFLTINSSSPVFIFPILRFLPIFDVDGIRKIYRDIDTFTEEEVKMHRLNFNEANINDFIDAFLLEQDKVGDGDSTFTDNQLVASVRDIFAGGTETTYTTLRWALLYLIHHPEWQRKLRDEIDDVIGQDQPIMEHKDRMPLVEAFSLEVQRLGNLTPNAVPHAPKENFHYKGYFFPKGTFTLISLDSVMTDPDIFPEPFMFKPERFLNEDGKCGGEQKEKLIPFSTGRRVCLGESLAKMEIFLFLTRILQKFVINPENPERLPPLEGTLGITNILKPYKLILRKR